MLEQIIAYMSGVDTGVVYLVLFLFAFIENVFPPSPSDVVVVFGASLIASTDAAYIPILFITSIGSAMGFILMYFVGKIFGEKILRSGRLKFIHPRDIARTDIWFNKYGYKLIAANRFLPGTRSVISVFSGIYKLDIGKTFLLAAISAFLWNALIIWAGMALGNNVSIIDTYLQTYSNIIIGLTLLAAIIFLIRYYIKRKRNKNQ